MFGSMDRSVSGMTVSEVDESESDNRGKASESKEKLEDNAAQGTTSTLTEKETPPETIEASAELAMETKGIAAPSPAPAVVNAPPLLSIGQTLLNSDANDDSATPMVERPAPFAMSSIPPKAKEEDDERSYDSDSTISAMPRNSPPKYEDGVMDLACEPIVDEPAPDAEHFISRLPRRSTPAPT